MPRVLTNLLLAGSLIGLAACANINTIARTTELDTSSTRGKAVHLDIQQRLLIVNRAGIYCAEPSPDALAAYAAAIGIGASSPASGAASAAGSGQSSAASVGLRTQSITLMRDALFRMCEAYANGKISPAQVAILLGRSQDLTAVILAVEQLTGAVAANQVALTGTTTADASATALATSELLDKALANESRKQKSLERATEELVAAKAERDAADRALKAAQAKQSGLPAAASQTQKDEAAADVAFRQAEFDRAQRSVASATERVRLRQTAYDNAVRTREAIQENQDAAVASASAATSSSAQFSTPVQRIELNKEATVAIASAVQAMIQTVLVKDYTQDSCMALLTIQPEGFDSFSPKQKSRYEGVQELCVDILSASIVEQIRLKGTVVREEAIFGSDVLTDRIRAWIDGDSSGRNRVALKTWLQSKGLEVSPTLFMFSADYAGMRRLAAKELQIQ